MHDEFNEIIKQHTWSLVSSHQGKNVAGCKWVFKTKKKIDDSIERYKAQLVSKGFNQQHGIDFDQTFCLIIKPTTILLVLSLVLNMDASFINFILKMPFLIRC